MKSNNERDLKLSRYFSYILRHSPQSIKLHMEPSGFVDIKDFMFKAFMYDNIIFDIEDVERIVSKDNKQRYEIKENMIRAVQGHSISFVNLKLKSIEPPQILYHGTKEKYMMSICKQGILSQSRQFVHLSKLKNVALEVGNRRNGETVILRVYAKRMIEDGYKFYQAKNGVWLTHKVPPKYFEIIEF